MKGALRLRVQPPDLAHLASFGSARRSDGLLVRRFDLAACTEGCSLDRLRGRCVRRRDLCARSRGTALCLREGARHAGANRGALCRGGLGDLPGGLALGAVQRLIDLGPCLLERGDPLALHR